MGNIMRLRFSKVYFLLASFFLSFFFVISFVDSHAAIWGKLNRGHDHLFVLWLDLALCIKHTDKKYAFLCCQKKKKKLNTNFKHRAVAKQ